MDLFPNNTTAKYVTHLHRRITLHGRWEVGLVEMHFPHTFYNVRRGEGEIKITFKDGTKIITDVPPNYYRTKEDFYTAFNKVLDGALKKSAAAKVLEDVNGASHFAIDDLSDVDKIKVSTTLANQLGVHPSANLLKQKTGDTKVDLDRGLPQLLYCYCDVIEDQRVGNTSAPLLRIVNTNTHKFYFGRESTQIFTSPIYLPVQNRDFSTIEIDLRDGTGNAIPFAHGTSAVLLHFRRVKEKKDSP